MLFPPLPDELTLDVVSCIDAFAPKTRQQTLAALCLTNKVLYRALRKHLYSRVDVTFPEGLAPTPALFNLLRTLIATPSLGEHVQEARLRATCHPSVRGWGDTYFELPIQDLLRSNSLPAPLAAFILNPPISGLLESAVCALLLLLPNIATLIIGTEALSDSGLASLCTHSPQPVLRRLRHVEIHSSAPRLLGHDTNSLFFNARSAMPLKSLTIDLGEVGYDKGLIVLDSRTSSNHSLSVGTWSIRVLRLKASGRLVLLPSFMCHFNGLTRFEMVITNARTLTYITPALSFHAGTLEHVSLVLLGEPTRSEPPIRSLCFLERLQTLHLSKSVLFGEQLQRSTTFDFTEVAAALLDREAPAQGGFSLQTFLPDTLEEVTLDITGESTEPRVFDFSTARETARWEDIVFSSAGPFSPSLKRIRLSTCLQAPTPSAYEGLQSAQTICYISPPLPATKDIFSKCYPAFHMWKTVRCAGQSSEVIEDEVRAWANERLRDAWGGDDFEQIMESHERDLGTSCFSKLESFHL